MLKAINQNLPEGIRDLEIYQLLNAMATASFFHHPGKRQKLIINLSLLKCLGSYPYFSHCGHCGRVCSESYMYDVRFRQFYGANCTELNEGGGNDRKYENGKRENIVLHKRDIIFLNRFYLNFKNEKHFFLQSLDSLNQDALPNPLDKLSSELIENRR